MSKYPWTEQGAMHAMIDLSTEQISAEIIAGRIKAHDKHGDNSIEAIAPNDLRWLSILVEEVGEAAHELTYDSLVDVFDGKPLSDADLSRRRAERLRAELIDVTTVAVAWISSIDRTWREGSE